MTSPYLSLPVRSLLTVRALRLISRLGPVAVWALATCQSVDIPKGENPVTYRSPQAVCETQVDPSVEWTRFLATNAGVAVKHATRDDRAEYDRKMAECLKAQ